MTPNAFSAVLWLTASGALALAWLAWRERPARGARVLTLLSASVALWCFGYGAELAVHDLRRMIFWSCVQYPGIAMLPPCWLLFSFTYSRTAELRSVRDLALIFLIPAVTVLAVWTNELHGLYYAGRVPVEHGALTLQGLVPGPLYWLFHVYSWGCILVACLALLRMLPSTPSHMVGNVYLLLIAAAVPFGLAIARALGWRPYGVLDVSSLGLAAPTVLFGYLMLRRRLLAVRPIARDMVLDNLDHGLMVVNETGMVVDANETMRDLLRCPRLAPSTTASSILERWPSVVAALGEDVARVVEVDVRRHGIRRTMEVEVNPVRDGSGHAIAHALVWRDVTDQRSAAEAIRRRDGLLEAEAAAAQALLTMADTDAAIQQALRTIGTAAAVDRVYVFENGTDPEGRPLLSQRYEWVRGDVSAQIANPDLQNLSYYDAGYGRWHDQLSLGRPIMGQVHEFPLQEQPLLEQQDIVSLMVVPITVAGSFWGFMGFDECHEERVWTPSESALLTAAASLVGNAIMRRRALDELAVSERRFRSYFDLPLTGIVIARPDRTITEANETFCRMVGYARSELVGTDWAAITSPNGVSAEVERHDRVMDGAESRGYFEKQYVRRDGSLVDAHVAARIVRGPGGAVEYVLAAIQDVTTMKETERRLLAIKDTLEDRVTERTIALENANEELGTFADTIAFELRGPLQTARSFHEEVVRIAQVDAETRHYLDRVGEGIEELLAMLNGMLRITRIAHSDVRRVDVDLSRLACELCDNLRASEPERRVDTVIAPAMTVRADPRFLETALDELLRNAWKFTSERDRAAIEVGSEETARGLAYFVRDNGAGFDPAHKAKLFRIFQRLHGRDEFEGRGIGLAVVQRVVHLHGGHVWAVGNTNEGATFYFTLPDGQA